MYYTHTLNTPWKLWRYKLQTQITQSRKATNSRAFLCGIGHPPADLVPDCSLLIFQPLLVSDFCSTVQSGTKYGPKQLFPISASGMSPKPLSFAPPVPRCGIHDALIYRPGATLCLAHWLGICFLPLGGVPPEGVLSSSCPSVRPVVVGNHVSANISTGLTRLVSYCTF